ncbi:5'-nucleotidase [Microbacterium horticulturae]|uniref:5'-nucleotidase n=1 Tax=Microbacterium horticulturae TaxID=3028316 RepID=A0ABY8BZD3_9MICO|nr:5'-nucleotidase [Microbacterium sp. KACC 23027]WEG09305.1 5'-nucleotidase [Microbacterium sp. KACC 23027]
MSAYDLSSRLVIGVASSALFNLDESNAFFEANGEDSYREYQAERIDDVLRPGVAFRFIRKLLTLNDLRPGDSLVEVIILSKNDPSTGLRVMRSVKEHGLSISRSVFTQGEAPYGYIPAFSMSLFLSADKTSVEAAMSRGYPAGLVLASMSADTDDDTVRVALDFDGVIASDEAERVYQGGGGLAAFQEHEAENRAVPLERGPLAEFLRDLNMIQEIERSRALEDRTYRPRLRVSIVTARNAPAHERAVNTLEKWGVTVNDAFFLGGIDKGLVLEVMRPDIYFDDQQSHLDSTSRYAASVLIPYGIANERPEAPRDVETGMRAAPEAGHSVDLGESHEGMTSEHA